LLFGSGAMGSGAGAQRPDKVSPEAQACRCRANVSSDFKGTTILAADVGGTSSRVHLFLPPEDDRDVDGVLAPERRIYEAKYSNAKFDSFTDVLRIFLKDSGMEEPPQIACLAVAGVVFDNRCKFVNRGWEISGSQLEHDLGIGTVVLINDFAAQGYGITALDISTECDVLQNAPVKEGSPIAILGAGTGLGEAFGTTGPNGDYEIWPTEGGHREFAPRHNGSSNVEFEMIQFLQIKYSAKARISVERVVSGRGLGNIYEFLAWKYPDQVNKVVHRRFIGPVEGPRNFDPAAVTSAASTGECELCGKAVDMWCGAYGSEAGVVALKYMPCGGLFLTGGVTSKLRDFIMGKTRFGCSFMDAFLDKGRVTQILMKVPVYLVKGEDLGERGVILKAQRIFQETNMLRKSSYGGNHRMLETPSLAVQEVQSIPLVS